MVLTVSRVLRSSWFWPVKQPQGGGMRVGVILVSLCPQKILLLLFLVQPK